MPMSLCCAPSRTSTPACLIGQLLRCRSFSGHLSLDPTYALAHGLAAMSYHNRFLRAGLKEEDRLASVRHARLAIEHGRDDAVALTFVGFSLGMDAHDRQAAFAAFEAALALSPSTALAWILGSVVAGWSGQAECAIEWSERGMRLSPFDPWAFAAYDARRSAISAAIVLPRLRAQLISPISPIPRTALPGSSSLPHSLRLGGSKRQRRPPLVCYNCSLPSASIANSAESLARHHWQRN